MAPQSVNLFPVFVQLRFHKLHQVFEAVWWPHPWGYGFPGPLHRTPSQPLWYRVRHLCPASSFTHFTYTRLLRGPQALSQCHILHTDSCPVVSPSPGLHLHEAAVYCWVPISCCQHCRCWKGPCSPTAGSRALLSE